MDYDDQNIKASNGNTFKPGGDQKIEKLETTLLLTLFLCECRWYRDVFSPNIDWRAC